MSYYMGDYYRGDPGIGSFFGGLFKKVASVATSFIPGVGPIASKVIDAIPAGGAKTGAAATIAAKGAAIVKSTRGAIIKHPVLSAAAAAGAAAGMGAGVEHMISKRHPGERKHRRMNPFNPRAARRAGRRIHSLIRHYRKYVGFVSPRKPKGRPYFKARKKAA